MSYTVLARKWRPRRFAEMVGQQHVVKAMVNSLAAERLHHAYLFAGTRGVGKTTLARILAKALNCAEGIVAEPCGTCEACVAIDDGRFVDLIEVDAASRTRVDDTRELMENTQYTPALGRFKVYLIDEVHMLSNHSFNALLKTLEEPPPHIKFLLATTDPQKLPVTVLSRCLQFNLKRLTVGEICPQLEKICQEEGFAAESDGLKSLARAADGSMRDGLSLLDQAIAFSAGDVTAEAVSAMLGSIDRRHVVRFVQALAALDGSALMNEVAELDEQAPDYGAVLDELMGILQRIAVLQLVGSDTDEESQDLPDLAAEMSSEDVQLFYQIALQGQRDLGVCRDYRSAFEMTLLRMLAFRPSSGDASKSVRRPRPAEPAPSGFPAKPTAVSVGKPTVTSPAKPKATSPGSPPTVSSAKPSVKPDTPPTARETALTSAANGGGPVSPSAREATPAQPSSDLNISAPKDWVRVLGDARITGAPRQLAEHCAVKSSANNRLALVLAPENAHLNTERVRNRLQELLREVLSEHLSLSIAVDTPPGATPAQIRAEGETERMRKARAAIESDPVVKTMQGEFEAVLEIDSIRPRENEEG